MRMGRTAGEPAHQVQLPAGGGHVPSSLPQQHDLSEVMRVVRADVHEHVADRVLTERRELDRRIDAPIAVGRRAERDQAIQAVEEANPDGVPPPSFWCDPAQRRRRGHRPGRAVAAAAEPGLPERHVGDDLGDRVRRAGHAPIGEIRRQSIEDESR